MKTTRIETKRGRSTTVVVALVLAVFMNLLPATARAQSLPEGDQQQSLAFLNREHAWQPQGGDSLVLRSNWEPWNPVTLILQPVFGTVSGFFGFTAGFVSMMAITDCNFGGCNSPQSTTRDALAIASWVGLTSLGLATGVSHGGDISGADGNFGLTCLGAAGGVGLGVGLIAALPQEADPARGIAAYLIMIASPIVVYNLTAEAESLPPPPDPNAPSGMPDYLRPDRGGSHSELAPEWYRSLRPTGAGEDWQQLTVNIPLAAVLGEN
jgi:uncharacterized membrane protein YfcA